jgi:uncharacterized membrane protein (UPF0127 family)
MKKLLVELADNELKRTYGLMDRKSLASNHGMLFKFPYAHHLRFWMKNTYIPLDIAFINNAGKIEQIVEHMIPLSTRAVTSSNLCRYALEVPAGWFKENGIKIGDKIFSSAIAEERKVEAQIIKKKNFKEEREKKAKPDRPSLDFPPSLRKELKKEKEIDKKQIEDSQNNQEDGQVKPDEVDIGAEEMEVEGEYPQSIYTVPAEEPEQNQIQELRDMRGKIKFADEHNLEMEILYWTKRGHMLPPRRVRKLEGEGYVIKNGPSGEMLVAFDTSPTIQGNGWSIKGMQPKSFILDNIVQLQLFDIQGKQLTDQHPPTPHTPQK